MSNKCRGLTLLEILVCIGILSVLAVLIGAEGRLYRERMRTMTCVANLRGLGTALHMYANEHADRLPLPCDDNVELGREGLDGALDMRYDLYVYDAGLWSIACPSDWRKAKDPDPSNPTYFSYLLSAPGLDLAKIEAPVVIAHEVAAFHGKPGMWRNHRLFSDNHVEPEIFR